ncbi:hypothetical protein DCCM_4479 [Desulfocucumis palustris]|uniref:BIG2 domain-containing protein n=2 Tax=Desulfocucumis palustris TaxID=1898651 RepID=A0A2L2XM11_9FIRM|nr:hypothetical protein DCCM_4479 [Desulfocucumis palustris]
MVFLSVPVGPADASEIKSLSFNVKELVVSDTLAATTPEEMGIILQATYTDGSVEDVTAECQFTTTKTDVIEYSSGLLNIKKAGKGVLEASYGEKKAKININVLGNIATFEVSPDVTITNTLQAGSSLKGKAYLTFSGQNKTLDVSKYCAWTSDDESVVTVKNGAIKAVGVGQTQVHVDFSLPGYAGETQKTIDIAVIAKIKKLTSEEKEYNVIKGTKLKLPVIYAETSEGTSEIDAEFKISNKKILEINSETNEFTALATGTAYLSASYAGKTVRVTVRVTNASADPLTFKPVSPASVSIGKSISMPQVYQGKNNITKFVAYENKSPDSINIENNKIYGLAVDPAATIQYSFNGISSNYIVNVAESYKDLKVSPSPVNMNANEAVQLQCTAKNSAGEVISVGSANGLKFSSSDEDKVMVSAEGLITAVSPGMGVKITVSLGNLKSTVTVNAAPSSGMSLTTSSAYSGTSIGSYTLPAGDKANIYAWATDAANATNITSYCSWVVGNSDILTVSNGLIQAKKPGQTDIVVTYGQKTARLVVTVTTSFTLAAEVNSITLYGTDDDNTDLPGLTVTYADGVVVQLANNGEGITWSSSNANIAAISGTKIDARRIGSTKINGEYKGKKVVIDVTVKSTVKSIYASSNSITLVQGGTSPFRIYAILEDNTNSEVTGQCTFAYSPNDGKVVVDPAAGTVTAADDSQKLNYTITVTYKTQTVPVTVTVVDAVSSFYCDIDNKVESPYSIPLTGDSEGMFTVRIYPGNTAAITLCADGSPLSASAQALAEVISSYPSRIKAAYNTGTNKWEITALGGNDSTASIYVRYQGKLVKFKAIIKSTSASPPKFITSYPGTSNITQTSFDLVVQLNELGKAYYVVVANDANAPSAAEVKNGKAYGGAAAIASGSIDVDQAATNKSATINMGLSADTDYDIFVVAEDNDSTPNLQAVPVKAEVKTLPLPALTVGSDTISEDAANDGSITATQVITLANGIFASDMSTGVSVNNLPSGMGISVTRDSDTQITIVFTGKANNHLNANDVNNASVTVLQAKITGAVSDVTSNSFTLDFDDSPVSDFTAVTDDSSAGGSGQWTLTVTPHTALAGADAVVITTSDADFALTSVADGDVTVNTDDTPNLKTSAAVSDNGNGTHSLTITVNVAVDAEEAITVTIADDEITNPDAGTYASAFGVKTNRDTISKDASVTIN